MSFRTSEESEEPVEYYTSLCAIKSSLTHLRKAADKEHRLSLSLQLNIALNEIDSVLELVRIQKL